MYPPAAPVPTITAAFALATTSGPTPSSSYAAKTGELIWGFQLVHHDLWDFDSAARPLVATLHLDGKEVPVVIQGNKSGLLYVLNRDTGKRVGKRKGKSQQLWRGSRLGESRASRMH
ncbi:MAG TPA: hypothetical protein VF748_00370 [Candidatus Acidoferrum sp.]